MISTLLLTSHTRTMLPAIIRLLALCTLFTSVSACVAPDDPPQTSRPDTLNLFSEVAVGPDVDSHQGYTTDGLYHYTIDTDRLDKRDDSSEWSVLVQNPEPFENLPPRINHLGDGDYYDGSIFVVGEFWVDCQNHSSQIIATYSATDLSFTGFADISAQGHEASSVVAVPEHGDHGVLYVTSYCSADAIWKYDLVDYTFLGTVPLTQTIDEIQGIAWDAMEEVFYVSLDSDAILEISPDGMVHGSVYRSGLLWGEGLEWWRGELRWLINERGRSQRVHSLVRR